MWLNRKFAETAMKLNKIAEFFLSSLIVAYIFVLAVVIISIKLQV